MPMMSRIPTTETEVMSICLERDLKERLKALAGEQGYQSLIRNILGRYVCQGSRSGVILARIDARAFHDQTCALTGEQIPAESAMYFGVTTSGALLPLSLSSLE